MITIMYFRYITILNVAQEKYQIRTVLEKIECADNYKIEKVNEWIKDKFGFISIVDSLNMQTIVSNYEGLIKSVTDKGRTVSYD